MMFVGILARIIFPFLPLIDRLSQPWYVASISWALRKRGVVFNGKPKWLSSKAFYDATSQSIIFVERGVVVSHFVRLLTHDFSMDRVALSVGAIPPGKELVRYADIRLKENCFIGIGATVLPGCVIGSGSIVAAGAVVTRSVDDNVVVAGNPARVISTTEDFLKKSLHRYVMQDPRR